MMNTIMETQKKRDAKFLELPYFLAISTTPKKLLETAVVALVVVFFTAEAVFKVPVLTALPAFTVVFLTAVPVFTVPSLTAVAAL